jgi:phosphodiesterase/alkaline phosphatase D-like protein
VLWARSDTLGALSFEVATDPGFGSIVKTQAATVCDPMVPVKAQIDRLLAGTSYFFRATDAASTSATGSFPPRPPPAFAVSPATGRGELAPYPAIKNVPARNLDFLVKLGDTIYAERYSGPQAGQVASTLGEYRARHNDVLSAAHGLNAWADVRAVTLIYAQINGHEVVNDFSGGAPVGSGFYNDTQRYRDDLQAF